MFRERWTDTHGLEQAANPVVLILSAASNTSSSLDLNQVPTTLGPPRHWFSERLHRKRVKTVTGMRSISRPCHLDQRKGKCEFKKR